MKSTLTLFLIITVFLFPSWVSAQFNVTTGYELSYQFSDNFNDIIQKFNTQNDFLDSNLEELKIMHGLQLGLRYEVENILAFTLGWKYRFKNSTASGTEPTTLTNVKRELFIRQNVLSVGFENQFGFIGYGATLDYNRVGFKQEIDNNSKKKISTDHHFGSTFYLNFISPRSNQIRLSVRPYIQIPWTKMDLAKLDMELNETVNTEKIEEGFMNFGIMFIFLNGG